MNKYIPQNLVSRNVLNTTRYKPVVIRDNDYRWEGANYLVANTSSLRTIIVHRSCHLSRLRQSDVYCFDTNTNTNIYFQNHATHSGVLGVIILLWYYCNQVNMNKAS